MRRRNLQKGFSLILAGICFSIICTVIQITSYFTLVFSKVPYLLPILGYGGQIAFFTAAMGFLYISTTATRYTKLFRWVGVGHVALLFFSIVSIYGVIFQYALAGLTIGASLVLLGSTYLDRKSVLV